MCVALAVRTGVAHTVWAADPAAAWTAARMLGWVSQPLAAPWEAMADER